MAKQPQLATCGKCFFFRKLIWDNILIVFVCFLGVRRHTEKLKKRIKANRSKKETIR